MPLTDNFMLRTTATGIIRSLLCFCAPFLKLLPESSTMILSRCCQKAAAVRLEPRICRKEGNHE